MPPEEHRNTDSSESRELQDTSRAQQSTVSPTEGDKATDDDIPYEDPASSCLKEQPTKSSSTKLPLPLQVGDIKGTPQTHLHMTPDRPDPEPPDKSRKQARRPPC